MRTLKAEQSVAIPSGSWVSRKPGAIQSRLLSFGDNVHYVKLQPENGDERSATTLN